MTDFGAEESFGQASKRFAYDAVRAQGLPCGRRGAVFERRVASLSLRSGSLPPAPSGEVEAAHRVIPQKRMKLPGAWWHPDHVNPMLALRVLRANGLWNTMVLYRLCGTDCCGR